MHTRMKPRIWLNPHLKMTWRGWARKALGLSLIGLTALLGACTSMRASDPEKINQALNYKASQLEQYTLGPADVVTVSVWRNPDLSVSVPVRPDGKISTPLIGDVHAAGLTPEKLAANIREKLSLFIREPQVSIVVTSMNSHEFMSRVRVTGAVRAPATMPFRPGMTVLDVVLSAGGLNDFANGNETILYRKVGNETVAIPVRLKDILLRGEIQTNYDLQPGDILTVPERML